MNHITVVSMNYHYNKNPTKRDGLVQSRYHHYLIECSYHEIAEQIVHYPH